MSVSGPSKACPVIDGDYPVFRVSVPHRRVATSAVTESGGTLIATVGDGHRIQVGDWLWTEGLADSGSAAANHPIGAQVQVTALVGTDQVQYPAPGGTAAGAFADGVGLLHITPYATTSFTANLYNQRNPGAAAIATGLPLTSEVDGYSYTLDFASVTGSWDALTAENGWVRIEFVPDVGDVEFAELRVNTAEHRAVLYPIDPETGGETVFVVTSATPPASTAFPAGSAYLPVTTPAALFAVTSARNPTTISFAGSWGGSTLTSAALSTAFVDRRIIGDGTAALFPAINQIINVTDAVFINVRLSCANAGSWFAGPFRVYGGEIHSGTFRVSGTGTRYGSLATFGTTVRTSQIDLGASTGATTGNQGCWTATFEDTTFTDGAGCLINYLTMDNDDTVFTRCTGAIRIGFVPLPTVGGVGPRNIIIIGHIGSPDITFEAAVSAGTTWEASGDINRIINTANIIGLRYAKTYHRSDETLFEGLVIAGSTTTVVNTNSTAADDEWNGARLKVRTPAGRIAVRRIVDYSLASGAFTVEPALPFVPATNNEVLVLPAARTDADVTQVSGQAAAAANLRSTFDGVGYADANAPSTQSQSAALLAAITGLNDLDPAQAQAAAAAAIAAALLATSAEAAAIQAVVDAILLDTGALDTRVPASPAAAGDVAASQAAIQADIVALNDLDSTQVQAAASSAIAAAALATSAGVSAAQAAIEARLDSTEGASFNTATDSLVQLSARMSTILVDTQALDARLPASPAAVGDVAAAMLAIQSDIAALNDLDSAGSQAAAAAAIAAALLATSADVAAAQAAVQADIAGQNDLSSADILTAMRSVIYTYTFSVGAGATASVIPTDATQADSYFDSYFVRVRDGALEAIAVVQSYANAGGVFSLSSPLPFVPSATATVELVGVSLPSSGSASGAATPLDVLNSQVAVQASITASQAAIQADISGTATPAHVAAAQAAVQSDIASVPAAVRDIALAGAAVGSLGEALLILFALAGKANVRLDSFQYTVTPPSAQMPNGARFLNSVRVRVFDSAASAGSSSPNAPGTEGATHTVTLTGVADLTHVDLPASILGLLT